jgi:hypothetical protein
MTLEERRQYLTSMLDRHKARVFDFRKQIDETNDLISALSGAMETVTDMIAIEQKAAKAAAAAQPDEKVE